MIAYRLFIAVRPSERVKDDILKAQAELRTAVPEGAVTWTRREQLHVTLKFLGNVDAGRIDDLIRAAEHACDAFSPLALAAAGIGMFPNARRPRVIWTSVLERRDRLSALQQAVERAAGPFTREPAERRFTGHVTLGRCKAIDRRGAAALGALAQGMENRSFGEWIADSIEIVRSEPGSGGSRYTTLAAAGLTAR